MPNRESPGSAYPAFLRLGYDELQWSQDELDTIRRMLRMGQAFEPGWVGGPWHPNGRQGLGWQLIDGGAGELDFESASGASQDNLAIWRRRNDAVIPYMGIDPNGQILILYPADGIPIRDAAGDPIVVPDDNVWRTLVAKATLVPREQGRLSLTAASTTITGSGTFFTRYGDSTDPRATKFRIVAAESTAGNEAEYTFATITDDENATITPAPPATEAGVPFRVIGDFSGAVADPDIHKNLVVTWELITRTVAPQADALIAYDCHRNGGTLTLIDRRKANIYRPMQQGHERRWWVMPMTMCGITGASSTDYGAFSKSEPTLPVYDPNTAASDTGLLVSIAGAGVGADLDLGSDVYSGMLGAFTRDAGATWRIEIKEYVPHGHVHGSGTDNAELPWRDPNGGAAVNARSGLTNTPVGLSLLAVPAGSGNTHLLFSVDSGNGFVDQESSGDNGATWSSDGVIWDPTATDEIQAGISAVLTRTGRIILVASYNAIGVRYIFSDDYGATWDTNTGAGYTIVEEVSDVYTWPHVTEDDAGNLWTAFELADGSEDTIRVIRGAGVNDPTPSSDTPTNGWKVSPDHSMNGTTPPNNFSRPQVVPCPDGQLLIFMTAWRTAVFADLGVAHVSFGDLVQYRPIMRMAATAATASTLPNAAVAQDAAGTTHTVFMDPESTGDSYRDAHWGVVPIQRFAAQWYGGL